MAIEIDMITTTAFSDVTEFSGSSGGCIEIEGDGMGEKTLDDKEVDFINHQDIEGDGLGEKSLGESFDNSFENPSNSMNQQNVEGDGLGEKALSGSFDDSFENPSNSMNKQNVEGDGIGEKALSGSFDDSFENPSNSMNQHNVEGDGLGEKALSGSFDDSFENPSNSMNQQNVEGDGIGEKALSESFDNSNENPSNSTNQKDVIGEDPLDSAKPNENNPDRRLQNENATDDNGKPYMKDGKLIPNNTYTLNGHEYRTDQYGRITHGEGKVSVNDSPRLSLPPIEGVGKGDDRGHIIAHVLGGADTEGNLVPMDSSLNRGEYKSMELSAKKALDEGKNVKLSVDIEYSDGKRPISFTVTLEVDDDITVKKFYNNAQ